MRQPNATTKHNSLRDWSGRILRAAGVSFESEPRVFQMQRCTACAVLLTEEDMKIHKRTCTRGHYKPTGPDLLVDWGDGRPVVYDFTVVHATAPSHLGTPLATLYGAKAAEKDKLYGEMAHTMGYPLVTLCVSSHGHLSEDTARFIALLAAVSGVGKRALRAEFLALVQRGNGKTLARVHQTTWRTRA